MKLIIDFFLLLLGAMIFAIPNITRRNILFGVPVPAGFRHSEPGERSIAGFRTLVGIVVIATVCAVLISPRQLLGGFAVVAPLTMLLAGVIGFCSQYRRLRQFAVQPSHQGRQADLSNVPDELPGFTWLAPGPFVIIAMAATFLYSNWERIPARFPVHWGVEGQPNGWAVRTLHGVYGPLLLGAELCAWMLVLALAVWLGARRSRSRRVVVGAIIAIEYMLGLLLAAISVEPILHIPIWLLVVTPMFFIAVLLIAMAHSNADPTAPAESTPNEAWRGGVIYYNAGDAALLVEKRTGPGYTVNFGNRWSWALLAGAVLIVVSGILLL